MQFSPLKSRSLLISFNDTLESTIFVANIANLHEIHTLSECSGTAIVITTTFSESNLSGTVIAEKGQISRYYEYFQI